MAKRDDTAVIVATMRNGRMTGVRYYTHREVDRVIRDVGAIRASGGDARVTVSNRVDGLGVTDEARAVLVQLLLPKRALAERASTGVTTRCR